MTCHTKLVNHVKIEKKERAFHSCLAHYFVGLLSFVEFQLLINSVNGRKPSEMQVMDDWRLRRVSDG